MKKHLRGTSDQIKSNSEKWKNNERVRCWYILNMPCCPRVRAGLRVAKPVLVHAHGHRSMIGPDPVPRTWVTAFFCTDTVTRENLEAALTRVSITWHLGCSLSRGLKTLHWQSFIYGKDAYESQRYWYRSSRVGQATACGNSMCMFKAESLLVQLKIQGYRCIWTRH